MSLKHLLDFRALFLADSPDPIDFTSRGHPHLPHDVFYLSSYIHDAQFATHEVRLRNKMLRIPMERALGKI